MLPTTKSLRVLLSKNPLTIILISLIIGTLISGCDIIDTKTPVEKAVQALDKAIDRLENQSVSWQSILEDTVDELTDEAQSTIRTEVSNTLNRAIAATGTQVQCIIDFIRNRIREDLLSIKAELLGDDILPPRPVICSVTPDIVDMNLDPERRSALVFQGYNFDVESAFTATHVIQEVGTLSMFDPDCSFSSGDLIIRYCPIDVPVFFLTHQDVTTDLHIGTHYQMTLNLGGNGVPLNSQSELLTINWQDSVLSSVPVIQRQLPLCDIETILVAPLGTHTFRPPLVRGDEELDGSARIRINVNLLIRTNRIDAEIYMSARENGGGNKHTVLQGTQIIPLYTAPIGWEIRRILDINLSDTYYDNDTNHNVDVVTRSGGPFTRLEVTGDTSGDDAGDTRVVVTFNNFEVEIQQVTDCIN